MTNLFLFFALSAPVDLPPIHVPYQIIPAFMKYTDCVIGKVAGDARSRSADDALVRQSNLGALASCKATREKQLSHALELQTDTRPYAGSLKKAQEAVRQAFDRFDTDYAIEPVEKR